MTTRITLISSGATAEIRNATFGGDAPLAPAEHARAASLTRQLPGDDIVLCGPDSASRQTAEALALAAIPEPSWREIDYGDWSGKSLKAVQEEMPETLGAWLSDPTCAPPGGESIAAFTRRIGNWLDQRRDGHEKLTVVAPANCLRATVLHCLRAPADAFLTIDILPLTIMQISAYRGLWRLRLGSQAERP
ncbi:MAG TPA: histidine phosphatase family protein [Dongiaceae bacterium]|nr:histidine phosphatase family protein [Dongiaceae bacterium]